MQSAPDVSSIDPYSPSEMALRAESVGVSKARLGVSHTLALAVLGGAFIALGAMFSSVVGLDPRLGYGMTRLLVGVSFSLGLILVVVGGAELFTGNNLIVMAWAHGKVSTAAVARNWALVYVGNLVGAGATAAAVFLSGVWRQHGGDLGAEAITLAHTKVQIDWFEAFVRGVLCNALVCMAVWLSLSGRSVADKILAVVFPITAFVAVGLEHSIANMYFIPLGLMLAECPEIAAIVDLQSGTTALTWGSFVWNNLVPVTLGNVFGGAVMVGLVYWFVYLSGRK